MRGKGREGGESAVKEKEEPGKRKTNGRRRKRHGKRKR